MVKAKEDLTGKVYGRLTVLRQANDYVRPDGKRDAQWLCECNCKEHNQIVVLGSNLKKETTQSCGCLKTELLNSRLKKENKYNLTGDYGVLWATNTNEEVYFDLNDSDIILKHTWYIGKNGYPSTNIDEKTTTLHAFLGYKWCDHKNRNKKDNRRENLRLCTQQENCRNSSLRSDNTSNIIGVNIIKSRNQWEARIWNNGKTIRLGYFNNKEDAIIARLQAECDYYGEFAPQQHLFEQYGIKIK